MKCIKRGNDKMLKVSNTVAARMVETEGYHYVDREAYKAQHEQLRNGTYQDKSVEEKNGKEANE